MNKSTLASTTLVASTTLLAHSAPGAETGAVDDFISKVKSKDDKVRGPAWQGAGPQGAPAVKPLGEAMTDPDFEVARSAKRALYKIVRHAGRPEADKEAKAVEAELVALLGAAPASVRREVLWMLSEIGGDGAIGPMAALLSDKELRDDARCALTRIPGQKATGALRSALAQAPADFKPALAESLRKRGERVEGYPSQKLVPTRPTTVGQPKTS